MDFNFVSFKMNHKHSKSMPSDSQHRSNRLGRPRDLRTSFRDDEASPFGREWFLDQEVVEIVDEINLQNHLEWEFRIREPPNALQRQALPNTRHFHPLINGRNPQVSPIVHLVPDLSDPPHIEVKRHLMDVFVEDLYAKSQVLRLQSSDITIQRLIYVISELYCIPPDELRLSLGAREISNFLTMTVKEAGISHNDTIRLKLRLNGGTISSSGSNNCFSSQSKFRSKSFRRSDEENHTYKSSLNEKIPFSDVVSSQQSPLAITLDLRGGGDTVGDFESEPIDA